MIRITKGPIPDVLRNNAVTWTGAVLAKIAAGEKPSNSEKSKYAHQEIKAAILSETYGKCAYCESKIRHIAYGDIEHVTPKNSRPELWFEWDNLTLACDMCNTNKKETLGVIDPYLVDPEDKLVFFGAQVWPKPGDEQADISIRVLKLNRDELVGKRQERIEYLIKYLDAMAKTQNPVLREVIEQDFLTELDGNKEYAALSRSIARELSAKGVIKIY